MKTEVSLYVSEALGKYGFPNGHPFGPDRQDAFWKEAVRQGLDKRVALCEPRAAAREELRRFHTEEHVERVDQLSRLGYGSIDYGDTPAYPGVFDASSTVVGAQASLAVDGSEATRWRVPAGTAAALTLDLGRMREFGGLRLSWAPGEAATHYAISLSDDAADWRPARRVVQRHGGA